MRKQVFIRSIRLATSQFLSTLGEIARQRAGTFVCSLTARRGKIKRRLGRAPGRATSWGTITATKSNAKHRRADCGLCPEKLRGYFVLRPLPLFAYAKSLAGTADCDVHHAESIHRKRQPR